MVVIVYGIWGRTHGVFAPVAWKRVSVKFTRVSGGRDDGARAKQLAGCELSRDRPFLLGYLAVTMMHRFAVGRGFRCSSVCILGGGD